MDRTVISRLAMGMILAAGLLLAAPPSNAAPSAAEVRRNTTKYCKIFQARGIRFELYYCKKIMRYLQANQTQRAIREYSSVIHRWNKKLGPHVGVNPVTSVAAVARAKRAKQWKVLEMTCMRARTTSVANAACKAATDMYADAGNNAKLKAICQGQGHRSPYKDWRNRRYACQRLSSAGSSAGMKAFNTASCSQLPGVFATHKQKITSGMNEAANRKNFVAVGMKFLKCKNWKYVIENLIHWGGRRGVGVALLNAIHKAGMPLEKKMLAYMKKHRRNLFRFKHAGFALDHYTSWLHKNRPHKNCRKYIRYAKLLKDNVWGNFSWYFRMTKCKRAANIVAKRLSSPRVATRKGACKTLGRIGNKRHLRKIKILARSDSYYVFRRGYRIFPVRAACTAAMNQIRLR